MPGVDPVLRERLKLHLAVCDACRLRRATERNVAAGLRAGRLRIEGDPAGRERAGFVRATPGRLLGATGFLATAAAFLLLYLLSPSPPGLEGRSRSPLFRPAFERPVEQEVLRGGSVRLSWYPVEQATRYRVTVHEIGGPYEWSGETGHTELRTPAENPLPAGKSFRAVLETIPSDLARPGGASVSFRTGTRRAVFLYRVSVSPAPVRLLGAVGLLLVLLSIVKTVPFSGGLTGSGKV